MSANEKSKPPLTTDQVAPHHSLPQQDGDRVFVPEVFAEFVTVLGLQQAALWFGRFHHELKQECSPAENGFSKVPSRANIHQICGRAGLIGFPALHAACLAFLEAGPGQSEQDAAHRHLCQEAARAYPEIEKHRAELV